MEIILASSSPRRRQLISGLVRNYDIIPSTVDEEPIKQKETNPARLVSSLSSVKAFDVFYKKYQKDDKQFAIIGADTIVSFKDQILGKPTDRADAFRMLKMLQNNANDVFTGMTVIIKKEHSIIIETVVSKSTVYFNPMSYQDITEYIDTKEPLDKAGAYAIQGIGKKYLKGFDGNYNAIVGLDTQKLKKIFEKYNII